MEERMEIRPVMDLRTPAGSAVPAVEIIPKPVRGGVVLLHAYGGCKEQMLWLAYEMAKLGVCSLAIDLAGHGENRLPAGPQMLDEVEAAVDYMRQEFELVGCGGAGLGGRLALMSSADYMAAIAPAIPAQATARASGNAPPPTVREPRAGYLPVLLRELGPVAPCERQCLLIGSEHGQARCRGELQEALAHAELRYVSAPDGDLAMNAVALGIAARWMAQIPGLLMMSRRAHAQ
jgi:hypothetical protein